MAKRRGAGYDCNSEVEFVSLRQIVSDRQFRSGYRDRLAGLPPRPFYRDSRVGGDDWAYERGRLTACYVLVAGQKPPKPNDIPGLARAYQAAEDADVVL